ncbi:hypothetical protein [Actinophytocola algeriensis]|uniref:Uncharacterized protein n=1 Tax=Actinophytocola algeriensis TaxID=1768010 RepID=A0A7W7Q7Y0_9PSEU|nr:hypothetical protein [Actinophytocola algeriensis]MBB4908508.1 hypothetical protein [Actinophytocola algeriensis]MBE1475105.1 hypothetical protein [Actinophytocola algeriensis]
MRITRRVPWWAALMGLLVVVAGCDPLDAGVPGAPPGVGGGGVDSGGGGSGGGGCGSPGENVRQRLPAVDDSIATFPNPCLPYSDLVGTVTGYIPETDRATYAATRFAFKVGLVANQFATAASLAECLYRADQLAIQVYQERDRPLSVGVVVVVGISPEAVADIASCYLFDEPPAQDPGFAEEFDPCLDVEADGGFVVFKVGSTETMCGAIGA